MNTKMQKIGIAIVSPSGYVTEPNRLMKAQEMLQQCGFNPVNYYNPDQHYQRFAHTDEGRIEQIRLAIENPEVKIIMALRGGYGISRILDKLDFKSMVASGKIFVGHSDFTALEMGLLSNGGKSLSGPMVFPDFSRDDPSMITLGHFTDAVKGLPVELTWVDQDNVDLSINGVFWGGNLTMLSHLVGTQWMPEISDGILFVEDVHEHPYRVERMLIQLNQAGILSRQKALILGQFNDYTLTDYDNGYSFKIMLDWLREHLSIPVLTGLPFGHVRDKVTLPIGEHVHLICDQGCTSLRFDR